MSASKSSKSLNRRLFALVLASLALGTGFLQPLGGSEIPLSLQDTIRRAEESSISLKLSREAATQAQSQAAQQRVAILPNVSLSGQQRRSETVSISNGQPIQTPPGNRFDGKVVGSMQVLNPQQISLYQAARRGVGVAELEVLNAQQTALASASQAYFAHLRNLRRMDVLDANIKRAKSLLELSRNQAAAGVATQIDVTRAESQLAQAEQARLQHTTVLVSSELSLKRLLDLPTEDLINLQAVALKRSQAGQLASEQLRLMREHRPDYQKAVAALDQARLELRAARWQRLPTLSLNGEYGTVAARVGDRESREAWLAYATLNVPVFDGLKASADTRGALSRQRSQELRLRQLSTQIDAELRLAYQDADSRNAQIAVATTAQRLAQEELSLARTRFEQGVADNREVVEAQNRLAVADDGLVEAVYYYNIARVELARSKGDTKSILNEVE